MLSSSKALLPLSQPSRCCLDLGTAGATAAAVVVVCRQAKHAKIFEALAGDEELPEAQLALASYAVSVKNLSEVYENILQRREEQKIRERFALLRSTYYKPTKVLRQKRSEVLVALEKSNQQINGLRDEGAFVSLSRITRLRDSVP